MNSSSAISVSSQALLVVDAQNGAMEETFSRGKVTSAISRLVDSARKIGVPLVWIQHEDEGMPNGSPQWEIVPELCPASNEIRVSKTYSDSFADTDLEKILSSLGVTHVYLCGAQSDACIRSTLFGALYRGFDATLVTDAHTTVERSQVGYTAEQAIALVNLMASYTLLPHVRSSVATADTAFPGEL